MLSIKLIKISIVLLFVTTTSGCAVMGDALKFMAEVGECYAGVDCVQDNGGFDGVTSDNGSLAAFVQSSIIDNSYRTSAPLSTRSLNTGSTSNRKKCPANTCASAACYSGPARQCRCLPRNGRSCGAQ